MKKFSKLIVKQRLIFLKPMIRPLVGVFNSIMLFCLGYFIYCFITLNHILMDVLIYDSLNSDGNKNTPISTKWITISHHKSLITKKTITYTRWKSLFWLWTDIYMWRLKPVNSNLPLLISRSSKTEIGTDSLPLKNKDNTKTKTTQK